MEHSTNSLSFGEGWGEAYMITATILGDTVQLTGNPVRIKCTGASVPAGSVNYEILLKIISADGNLDGAPFTRAKAPDTSGEAKFDISGFVDQPVDRRFQFPVINTVTTYTNQFFSVQVQTGEAWLDSDGVFHEEWGATSTAFVLLKGGVSQRQLNIMSDAATNFYETYIASGKFLTGRPQDEPVHPEQPVKLWFIPSAAASATFKVTGYYDDGTNAEYTGPVNLVTTSLYEFDCNPGKLGLDMENASKKMTFYDVTIDGITCENRRFYVDWEYCERPVFMFFANTLGGIDDAYLSGAIRDKFITEGNTAYKPADDNDTAFDATRIVTGRSANDKWTINTGWKRLTHMQYLRNLLLARKAWYIYTNLTQTTEQVIPVIAEPGEKELINRQKNLYAIDIDITEAHFTGFTIDNRTY